MKEKFEFEKLPIELKFEIAQYLTTKDIINFVCALRSKDAYYNFFVPEILEHRKLLHYVVRSEFDKVQAILKKNINLIFKSGKVTDCSGRTFEHVSGFEYTIWSLDEHLWNGIRECVPRNKDSKEILEQLIAQCNKVKRYGVTYTLNGKIINERHFKFNDTIIKELETQNKSIYNAKDKNWEIIDNQWREGVGGAQKLLPMHVVHEYCSSVPFFPLPDFTTRRIPSKKIINYMNEERQEDWFNDNSKLSVGFAAHKGKSKSAVGVFFSGMVDPGAFVHDLFALKHLLQVRINAFANLPSQLEKQIEMLRNSELDSFFSFFVK